MKSNNQRQKGGGVSAAEQADTQESASDIVFHGIVNGLDSHQFIPGQRLVENDLVAHFGVGRNSVREGLQRLAADGIIEIVRHKGAIVRSLSLRETLDVLDVAERMTGLLAKTAARAVAAGGATKELERTLQIFEQNDHLMASENFAKARRQFYRTLLEMSGSQELRRLFRAIHIPIVHAQHRLSSLNQLRVRDYQTIGRAVLKGDEMAADAAGMAHVRHVRDKILKQSL